MTGNRTLTHGMEPGVQRTQTFSYRRTMLTNEQMNTQTNEWVNEQRNESNCPRRKCQVPHCHGGWKTGRFSITGDRRQNHTTQHHQMTAGLNLGTWNSHLVHSDQICHHGMALSRSFYASVFCECHLPVNQKAHPFHPGWVLKPMSLHSPSSLKYIYPLHSSTESHAIPPVQGLKTKVSVLPY